MLRHPHIYTLCSAFIALVMAALLWQATRWGVGTAPDSIAYLLAANSLQSPTDIFAFNNNWPPLYPLVLAAIKGITGDVLTAARALHCSLYALNILLFALWIRRMSPQPGLPWILGILAFALGPAIFPLHYMALSEALFLTLLLGFLILFDRFLRNHSYAALCAAALLLGLLVLTRYAGLAFVGSACLYLMAQNDEAIKPRLLKASTLASLSLLLPVLWQVGASFHGQDWAPRQLSYHLIDLDRLHDFIGIPLSWLRPDVLTPAGAMALGALILSLILWTAAKRSGDKPPRVRFLLWLVFLYVVFLLLSISFFEFYSLVDNRILLPVFVLTLAALILAIQACSSGSRLKQAALCLLLLIPVLSWVPDLSSRIRSLSDHGSGYLSREFRSQEILAYLAHKQLPEIYTNAPETLQLFFDRPSRQLPRFLHPASGEFEPAYPFQLEEMKSRVLSGDAVVVYFERFGWRAYYPDKSVLGGTLELPILHQSQDGVVYGHGD